MEVESKLIRCPFIQFREGKLRCALTDENLVEDNRGCPSCVYIPKVKFLIDKDENYKNEIRQALNDDHATLVLGAGISTPMKMPMWKSLISKLAGYVQQYSDYTNRDEIIDQDIRLLYIDLEQKLVSGELEIFNEVNALESGQYIEQALRRIAQDKPIQALLKESLSIIIEQSTTPDQWKKDHPQFNPQKDQEDIAMHNSLCASAYLLCAKNGFRHALTYNFDTLVQEFLIEIFGVDANRIFTHPGEWSTYSNKGIKDPIDIFHVHGCIPRRENQICPSCPFPKESNQIIFTERSYYTTEQSGIYNWQNSIQSYYLNRDNCVFVGFSAEDYNFRRILRQIEKNHPIHYLILTIDNMVKDTWLAVCRSHLFSNTGIEQVYKETLQLLKIQLDMKRDYWNEYNFKPIWVTKNDIPEFLLSLIS